jgi:hypothetical protein
MDGVLKVDYLRMWLSTSTKLLISWAVDGVVKVGYECCPLRPMMVTFGNLGRRVLTIVRMYNFVNR